MAGPLPQLRLGESADREFNDISIVPALNEGVVGRGSPEEVLAGVHLPQITNADVQRLPGYIGNAVFVRYFDVPAKSNSG